VVIDESLEFLRLIKLSLNFSAPKLVTFIESIDSIEGTQGVDKLDIDWRRLYSNVIVDTLDSPKLKKKS